VDYLVVSGGRTRAALPQEIEEWENPSHWINTIDQDALSKSLQYLNSHPQFQQNLQRDLEIEAALKEAKNWGKQFSPQSTQPSNPQNHGVVQNPAAKENCSIVFERGPSKSNSPRENENSNEKPEAK
jgi:hypothetical protein